SERDRHREGAEHRHRNDGVVQVIEMAREARSLRWKEEQAPKQFVHGALRAGSAEVAGTAASAAMSSNARSTGTCTMPASRSTQPYARRRAPGSSVGCAIFR